MQVMHARFGGISDASETETRGDAAFPVSAAGAHAMENVVNFVYVFASKFTL